MGRMLEQLTGGDFSPHLGERFTIRHASPDPLIVELIEVTELGSAPSSGVADGALSRRRPFSIVFQGPAGSGPLPQSIYSIEHENLGVLDLFVVPIGSDHRGTRYEAIFT